MLVVGKQSNGKCQMKLAPWILVAVIGTSSFAFGQDFLTDWKMQAADKTPGATAEAVSTAGFDAASWYKATVPGTVLRTLVDQKVYPDPYFGDNLKRIPELTGTNYFFRSQFTLSPAYKGKRVWLHFDGINWKANIWLNGVSVGNIAGAFKHEAFDVTATARLEAPNYLAVEIVPPPHPGRIKNFALRGGGGGGNGGQLGRDCPTFTCAQGWDWINTIPDRDIGIWKQVYTRATGPVVVREPHVTTDLPLPALAPADIAVSARLINVTDAEVSGRLIGTIGSITFEKSLVLPAHADTVVSMTSEDFAQLKIAQPRLWWPQGYGQPNLYSLTLKFQAGQDVSDAADLRFGIRKMSYEQNPNLVIKVNNVPIYCRGGDWGMDEAMKDPSPARMIAQIRLHKEANIVMIRNWVGQTDDEIFYDACDESGILVWDEFWLGHPADGPIPDDNAMFLDNARDKIIRYRNHPCVALWCARNEGYAPPALDTGIGELIQQLDPTRRYQRNSAAIELGVQDGPYGLVGPERIDTWLGRQGFKTETGMQCVPSFDSVKCFIPASSLEQPDDIWGWHQFSLGYTRFITSRYGSPTSAEDLCKKAQFQNLEGYRGMIESYNRRMWNPNSAILLWTTQPAQPTFTWQTYDWYLEPTAAYFGVKSACEPIHIQMDLNGTNIRVLNTTQKDLDLIASAEIYDLAGGAPKAKQSEAVSVKANQVADSFAVKLPENLSDIYFVKLRLTDAAGAVLSDNFYWRNQSGTTFTEFNNLPKVALTATGVLAARGKEHAIEATLTNPSTSIILMVRLKLVRGQSNERVLPTYYGDNYFSLTPGETRKVSITFDPANLAGQQPKLMLEGWNVTTSEIPIQ